MAPQAANSPVTGVYNPTNPIGFNDTGYWSTGNGWAAAGMLRVIGTIINSHFRSQFRSEVEHLKMWIEEIHMGMSTNLPSSGLFNNYADDPNTFVDAASTALFAATVYRAIDLYAPLNYTLYLDAADRARSTLYDPNGNHFDANGWLQPVVDPNMFGYAGSQSPEGQAFILQLDNNWKLWQTSSANSTSFQTSVSSPTSDAHYVLPLFFCTCSLSIVLIFGF